MHKCVNNSTANLYHLEQFVSDFFPYSQKQLGFDKPVTIKFESDENNASTLLGKTAFYDPENLEVVLFVDGRHPKDVMRSLSHELVHHAQNCRGDFGAEEYTGAGYAQKDPHLRKMEREAYTKGNLIFRDFEDLIKTGKIEVLIDFTKSGESKMSLKEWKDNEINTKLMKKWGFLKESKENLDERWATSARRGSTMPTIPLEKQKEDDPSQTGEESQGDPSADIDPFSAKGKGKGKKRELSEDSGEEESEHYGKDESADKSEENRLEQHLDAIEGHLKALRDDMHFDEKHIDENKEDDTDLEESSMRYRTDSEGKPGEKEAEPLKGAPPKVTPQDPEWYGSSTDTGHVKKQVAGISAARKKSGSKFESMSRKISVREAKEITRRIIERVKKEGK